MNTRQVADLTGVSVRTLHHYDRIGLLRPSRNPENGYRAYSEQELDRLQQILFFRECGFSLTAIQSLLKSPSFDRAAAFALQKKHLLYEKQRIEAMLDTLEKSSQAMRGEITMTNKEKFSGFDFSHNPYEEEARRLWGNDAVEQSNASMAARSEEERGEIAQGMDALFARLSELRFEAPDSETAQRAMDDMYRYFNQNFGYRYTLEAFAGVGQLYITDERFTENIDRYGEGLSAFLAEAMRVYAERGA